MTKNCQNVSRSFRDKWEKNPDLVFNETNNPDSEFFNWILRRNGFANIDELKNFLSDKKRILDAGCGNGRVTALLHTYSPPTTKIVGIDLVSADVARKNLENFSNISIKEMDLS
ncbi:MAG TPA: class I SAM-dependent methyltransferase [Methanoregulaceae archaeon]|nr:class I SAM-dependent methyltransferase [Methanoregulaceae archaeon]